MDQSCSWVLRGSALMSMESLYMFFAVKNPKILPFFTVIYSDVPPPHMLKDPEISIRYTVKKFYYWIYDLDCDKFTDLGPNFLIE